MIFRKTAVVCSENQTKYKYTVWTGSLTIKSVYVSCSLFIDVYLTTLPAAKRNDRVIMNIYKPKIMKIRNLANTKCVLTTALRFFGVIDPLSEVCAY
jgi:hypothetical protein